MKKQKHYYTDERNAQIVIALLKAHGIRRVVANPGTTNIAFVGSVQNDPFFEVYSGVDERHSSYLACGMAAESGEPVVLSCTGATASRNYISALTEAYYRKLPILALTSIHHMNAVGNLLPQMMDRRVPLNDMVRYSLQCPVPHTLTDVEDCVSNVNKAILELFRHGGGPVHINLETERCSTFNTHELPDVRVIRRVGLHSGCWPELTEEKKVAVWIGSHKKFTTEQSQSLEAFVRANDAVVVVDHTSGYRGFGAINAALLLSQEGREKRCSNLLPDVLIQIGEISGDYQSFVLAGAKEIWRVSEDGDARDLFNKLTYVFEMPEMSFFAHYSGESRQGLSYFESWKSIDAELRGQMPDLPFSNFWIAQNLHDQLPKGCAIHFGILNSLRSWNFQTLPEGVDGYCNVGGFGIDGCLSALIGSSLVNPMRLYFGVVGDLAFFYDINSLGNRHIGKNLRILLINNGCGAEFNLYSHYGSQFGEQTNDYIAAGGHNGKCSRELVKHFVTDLGFKYLSASTKDEFNQVKNEFLDQRVDQPIVFECFTDKKCESDALKKLCTIIPHKNEFSVKDCVKAVLPQGVKNTLKDLIK